MNSTASVCAIALCGLSFLAQRPAPTVSPGDFTLSVNVDLVLFNVSVTDKKGRVAPGLSRGNFTVTEDGTPQEIRQFYAEDTPATVGLVIDNSGSMVSKRSDVIEAAFEFVGGSNPQDELFLVNFNDHVSMGLPETTPFANNSPAIRDALFQIKAIGKTALYDGIAQALRHLEKGSLQKKALVVLSDGGDNASHRTLKDVLHMAEESRATVYTIGFFDSYQTDSHPKVLRQLAKLTGAESYVVHNVEGLEKIWQRIAGGIRSQYTLGYISTNPNRDGSFRNVKISAVDKEGKPLQIRARTGYLAAK